MTATRVSNWIRTHVLGLVALFLALSGGVAWANHPGGADTISSGDIINGEVKTLDLGNGEVKNDDLGTNAVGSEKISNRGVRNDDLGPGASSSNTIADGGIRAIDVQNNTLTGTQIDEGTLFNDNSLTGADIDESTLSGVPSVPMGPAGGDLDGTYPDPTIANTAVTIPKLSFDPATQVELDNLSTDDGDPPNVGSNLLNWNRLGGVPAGIADGDDVGWDLGGNSGTDPATQFLGTTDNQPLNLRVNDARALRLEPASDGTNQSPNVIGGSADNSVTAGVHSATIGGGGRSDPAVPADANRVTDHQGTVGGGANNQAGDDDATLTDADLATVGGGLTNTASGRGSTVGGGANNAASSFAATVGGGNVNTASDFAATVGGGNVNTATGLAATVPGGDGNQAQGEVSLAAGRFAQANHDGAFVWADSNVFDFASTAQDQFNVRSTGGARFVSGIDGSGTPTAGVTLAAGGGSWASLSDEAAKTAIESVSGRELLDDLESLPISKWSYRSQGRDVRHIGPMAQDFYRAFNVGEDERHITSIDADGVALAAIKGLNATVRSQERRIAGLEARLAALERDGR